MDRRWYSLVALALGCSAGCSIFLGPSEPFSEDEEVGGDREVQRDDDAGAGERLEDLEPFGGLQARPGTALLIIDDDACGLDTGARTFQCGLESTPIALETTADGEIVAVLAVDHFEVGSGAYLRIIGDHPLAIVARSIVIGGIVEAGSQRGGESGPGAATASCGAFLATPPTAADAGRGGASFGAAGGPGGDGSVAGGESAAPLSGSIEQLRAGCGEGASLGGGALQLSASEILEISGILDAGGSGGAGGNGDALGGEGGGSGGMIILDSPLVWLDAAVIAANGGGGGGGGGRDPISNDSLPGVPGSDSFGLGCALGGGAPDGGGGGGAGGCDSAATATSAGLAGATGGRSGGGGGGGGGVIAIRGEVPNPDSASTSPLPVQL